MNPELFERVSQWIEGDPDEADRSTLSALLESGDEAELHRRFDTPLTFGTAGLRGPEMAGPAGMNRYTVRRATQGVVAWLEENGIDPSRGVVVGRDARHGSETFNDEVVAVLLGAGVSVFEMPGPLPTPLVAFAVKSLQAGAGIMITASHNPPQDNGFKLYARDGAQIEPPHDEVVERFANSSGLASLGDRASALHHVIEPELLAHYRSHFAERFGVLDGSDLKITYTPLHGVGGVTMMELFARAGFHAVTTVARQFAPDADFPTLAFPNPEEPGALDLAMASAHESGSSLVLANDPDADRLGVALRGPQGWRVLRGDEVGWLLASALMGEMTSSDDVVATSVVSSSMLETMANAAHVRCVETLTGFKWIARAAGDGVLRFGYEEALGYAVDPLVPDKDGMSAALALSQLAHQLAQTGLTLFDRLDEIESTYGVHAGVQLSFRAEGVGAMASLERVFTRFKANPPSSLGGIEVSECVDLSSGSIGLMPTEGLILQLGKLGSVVVRPSGTEPKLKAYIEILGEHPSELSLSELRRQAQDRLEAVRDEMDRLLAI